MKKVFILAMAVLMLAFVFAGCGQTPAVSPEEATQSASEVDETSASADASDEQETVSDDAATAAAGTPAESYTAYVNAKTVVIDKLSDGLTTNSDTMSAAFTMMGVALVDLMMLPVSFFGSDEASVEAGLAMLDATDVDYSANGNTYTYAYTDAQGVSAVFTGTYDAAADALVCSSSENGTDTFFAEYRKTSFGYVSQYYFINDDGTTSLYQFAVSGEDGMFGISTTASTQPAALTGSESADFPAALPEWYSITGSTITGITSDGTEVNFEYVPSAE